MKAKLIRDQLNCLYRDMGNAFNAFDQRFKQEIMRLQIISESLVPSNIMFPHSKASQLQAYDGCLRSFMSQLKDAILSLEVTLPAIDLPVSNVDFRYRVIASSKPKQRNQMQLKPN